ncbi:3 beta-hydroxysteroid dehydrogenase type 7-like protein [Dinothrombium tinctorium]|uniref:3 beta-hydroxysteroid dehydrogenase type 7-like protein n=1 Tax=Dinothrombium tinctorium TaxID=1965070 RepID=A0A3S3P497_9ACAR|nr:3 beta-hydroxysteroid dehydrogenase type 7-like protein [Dinothrombium tinctorium]
MKQTVLVTGASGFLGQHIIRLLQEKDPTVGEIRCLDLKPYYNNLDHLTPKAMKVIKGDIRNVQTVNDSVAGVDCIIHCAELMDRRVFANEAELKSVNVNGTENLLEAAKKHNVRYFIYVSTIDVVCGPDPIYYAAENTVMIPKSHCFDAFAKSKIEAEKLVQSANEELCSNGVDRLQTVILRPTSLYGEEDTSNITAFLRTAKECDGCLPRIDNTFIRIQITYAGNAAWACIKAKDKLQIDQSIGGEIFFITDDTPIMDPFDFVEPILKACGLRLSKRAYPYWLLNILLTAFVYVVKLINPIIPIPVSSTMNPGTLQYVSNIYFFNRNKAILRLDYEPLYDSEESQKNSIEYYKSLNL